MLSSLVAVGAVVAIVAGLLVLFGTRGHDSKADEKPAASHKSSGGPSTAAASIPRPSEKPTTQPPTEPTTQPPTQPTKAPSTTESTQPTQPPATTTQPTHAVTIPAEERPAIEVYNNTPRKGLADSVAMRARQAGWTVAGSPDNWHGKVAESTVYYPPGMLDAANQLAHDVGIGRTKGALDNMKKDRLTVILTSDYVG
ncbi:MAG TPA: LytR C-terminal domain-containing protein [Kribbella sp.]|nr:LytR C-terminal domain-containing protein [Kribbella sp.]